MFDAAITPCALRHDGYVAAAAAIFPDYADIKALRAATLHGAPILCCRQRGICFRYDAFTLIDAFDTQ